MHHERVAEETAVGYQLWVISCCEPHVVAVNCVNILQISLIVRFYSNPCVNPAEKMVEVSIADKLDYVKSKIGEHVDFPKKGVIFR